MRLFPGCFHTWNLDCESVFTFFQQYGWFLVFMAECVKCRVGTFLGLMTASGLPSLVALYGLMAFMAMTGCCRGEISGFMAEKNGCCSWACGDAAGLVKSLRHTQRLEMDAVEGAIETAFLVVLVHCWGAAGAFVEGFSKMVCGKQQRHRQSRCKSSTSACKCVLSEIGQRAAAASAACVAPLRFHAFRGASAATVCKCVLCQFGQHAAAAPAAALSCKSPEILLGEEKSEFLGFSSGLFCNSRVVSRWKNWE